MKNKTTSVTPTQAAEVLGTCGGNASMEAKESQQTGHTPGPWEIENGMSEYTVHSPQMDVCTVLAIDINDEEAQANARLIAAAPELLLACEVALDSLKQLGQYVGLQCTLREAIAKAEGKTNE